MSLFHMYTHSSVSPRGCISLREGLSQPILLPPGVYEEDGSRGGILPFPSYFRMGRYLCSLVLQLPLDHEVRVDTHAFSKLYPKIAALG